MGTHVTDALAPGGVATAENLEPSTTYELSLEMPIDGNWTDNGPSVVAETDVLPVSVTADRPNALVTLEWQRDRQMTGRGCRLSLTRVADSIDLYRTVAADAADRWHEALLERITLTFADD